MRRLFGKWKYHQPTPALEQESRKEFKTQIINFQNAAKTFAFSEKMGHPEHLLYRIDYEYRRPLKLLVIGVALKEPTFPSIKFENGYLSGFITK